MKKLNPHYVTGFTEGEGSFYIGVFHRKKMKNEWEVVPSFSISQNKRDKNLLESLVVFFNCGFIRESKSDNTLKYEVRSLHKIEENVIPHFRKYPLIGEKAKDFEFFQKVIHLMKDKKHLERKGFERIIRIVLKMTSNPKRIRSLKNITLLKE